MTFGVRVAKSLLVENRTIVADDDGTIKETALMEVGHQRVDPCRLNVLADSPAARCERETGRERIHRGQGMSHARPGGRRC